MLPIGNWEPSLITLTQVFFSGVKMAKLIISPVLLLVLFCVVWIVEKKASVFTSIFWQDMTENQLVMIVSFLESNHKQKMPIEN